MRGSGLGTHIHPWRIHADVWQNQYSIVKQNKVKKKKNRMFGEKRYGNVNVPVPLLSSESIDILGC